MFELTEKRALVTGASGAIGGAIARGLHRQGAIVALSGTRQTVLAELAAALGERAHVVAADLGDAAATSDLPARAAEAMGGLDILVNNAGVTGDGLAVRMKDEDWQRVIDVNLTSAFRLSRAALKMMMRQRWGRIISITSIVGNFAPEFLLKGHHEFNRVKAVGPQVVDKTCRFRDLVFLDAQMFHDNFFHAIGDVTHSFDSLESYRGR